MGAEGGDEGAVLQHGGGAVQDEGCGCCWEREHGVGQRGERDDGDWNVEFAEQSDVRMWW